MALGVMVLPCVTAIYSVVHVSSDSMVVQLRYVGVVVVVVCTCTV